MWSCMDPSTLKHDDKACTVVGNICWSGFHDSQVEMLPYLLHYTGVNVCQTKFLGSRLRPPKTEQAFQDH